MKTPEEIKQWIAAHLHSLECPHAWLGDEPNSVHKSWDSEAFKLLLVGSMSYTASEGNLAVPLIYSLVNHERPAFIVERSYFPNSRNEIKTFRDAGIQPFSLESKHRYADFDVVAFSVSYIMPYLHIPFLLHESGIPVYAKDRGDDHPIVMVGGCMSFVSEILAGGNGGVYDFAYIGEAEAHFTAVLDFIRDARAKKTPKWKLLWDLAQNFTGIYVPAFYKVNFDPETKVITGREPDAEFLATVEGTDPANLPERITKAWVRNLDTCHITTDPVISFVGGMSMGHIEIARGCSNSCNFCQEGFCIEFDSKVLTDHGQIPIGSMVKDGVTDYPIAVEVVTENGSPGKAVLSHDMGVKPTIKVKTRKGFALEGSLCHPLFAIRDGGIKPVRLRHLDIGDQLVLVKGHPRGEHEVPLKFGYRRQNNASKDFFIDRTLTPLMSYVFGYFLGDGYLESGNERQRGSRFAILCQHADVNFFVEALASEFGEVASVSADDSVFRVRINNANFIRFMEDLGFARTAKKKHVPSILMGAGRACVAALLSGLFDADGGVAGESVVLTSTSAQLIQQVQILLLEFGTVGNVFDEECVYRLIISDAESIQQFEENIGFRLLKKFTRLQSVSAKDGYGTVVYGLSSEISSVIQGVARGRARLAKKFYDNGKDGNGISLGKLREFLQAFDHSAAAESLRKLKEVANPSLAFDVVASLESSSARVCDLTVEPEHRFIANGFLSSNTYRPYRERSVDRAVAALKETMRFTGASDVVPSAFTSSDHHQRNLLMKRLLEEVTSDVSIISQRADAFGQDPIFAELTGIGKSHTVSIGMEGVSQRIRDVLNKCIREEDLLKAIQHAIENNYTSIKLFMIANVPGTIDADYEELMGFLDKVNAIKAAHTKKLEDIKDYDRKAKVVKCEIKLSFTPLFISGLTPFQWYGVTIDGRDLTPWISKIKEKGFGFRLGSGARYDEAYLSQLFHLGDRRLTTILVKAAVEDELVHFGGTAKGTKQKWEAYLNEIGLSFEFFFKEKPEDWTFPWDYVDNLVTKKALYGQFVRSKEALSNRIPCIRDCYGCGACDKGVRQERKDWEPDLKQIDVSTLQIVKQRMKSREFMWVRCRFEVDPMHRTVPKDHWVLQVRRAAYMADWPIDKGKISRASDRVQLFNWVSGVDYVDIGFLEAPPKPAMFIHQMNANLSGAKVTSAMILGRSESTKKMRSVDVITWYSMPLDRQLDEVRSKIVAFMGLSSVPRDVKVPNDEPGKKVGKEEKNAFMKAYPTVFRIQKKGQRGIIRKLVDFRPLIEDMWVGIKPQGNELHMLVRGGISPYDVYRNIIRTSWKAGMANTAVCLGMVDGATVTEDEEDFFTESCKECGRVIERDLVGAPVSAGLCIKHFGRSQ